MSDRLGTEQQREMLPSSTKSNHNNRNRASRQEKNEEFDKGALKSTIANPFSAHPNNILAMQRVLGNQAVNGIIQAKLSVGSVHNQFEQEADRLAEQVTSGSNLNRQEKLTSIKGMNQRVGQTPQSQSPASEDSSFEAKESVERRIKSRQGAGRTLPDDTRRFMESKFGTDLSQVRIHTGHEAGEISQELNAEAFTHGRDIYMAEGRYKPNSQGGQRLLAHEITHVIQQGGITGTQAAPQLVQRVLGAHRTKGDEERRWASPSGPRTEPTSTALLGTHRTQQVGAQAGSRRAPASPLLGIPSISQDPQRYVDWLRTHPGLQSEAERQLTGAGMQDFHFSEDLMDDLADRRKAERDEELLALGTGRGQPKNPHAHDEAGDLVSMVEDPRFRARYQTDRQSDHGNWFARKFKKGKEKVLDKFQEVKSFLPGQHSVVPGEDYGETKSQKAKRVAKTVIGKGAQMITDKVPFLGSSMTLASAVKEGQRQKVAKDVGKRASAQKPGDAMNRPLLQRMSQGLEMGHQKQKIIKGFEAGIGFASDAGSVVTAGISKWASSKTAAIAGNVVSPLLEKMFEGAEKGVKLGEFLDDELLMRDRKYRRQAVGATNDEERSSALGNLAAQDPKFGKAMLDHLAPGQMSLGRELYTNRMIQKPKEGHTLKPSNVANLGRQELGRLRERERMGASSSWDLDVEKEQAKNRKKAEKAAKKMGSLPTERDIPQASPAGGVTGDNHPRSLLPAGMQTQPNLHYIPQAPPRPAGPSAGGGTGDNHPRSFLPAGMQTRPPERENLLRRLLKSEEEKWYE